MKSMKLLMIAVCVLGFVGGGFAQNVETNKTPVFGYMDPKTGLFHSLTRQVRSAEEPTISPTTGKFVFNVTITVSAGLSSSAVIGCTVAGGVADLTTGEFTNVVSVTAARSGRTATCTLNVPYSWDLAAPASDVVAFDLSVTAAVGKLGSASFYEESFTAPGITTKVPANGATTTEDITTTI